MRNRYRIEIYDEVKENDITLFADDGVTREYLSELMFSNIKNFVGNVKAFVYDNKRKRKTLFLFLPMETVNRYNKTKLTRDELGII